MTRVAIWTSTVLGIGYTPFAPGTMASLVALPLGYLLHLSFGILGVLIVGLVVFAIGIWASGAHARSIDREDPGTSVIDEIAGQLLAMLSIAPVGSPSVWVQIVMAFVLFRFFDIVKPWPISRLESLQGGLGIMADDAAAGLVSAVILFAVLNWWVM